MTDVSNDAEPYMPLADYGMIGNLRTIALVGIDASIDWLCFPELDSASVFGALLDHCRGGRFRIAPVGVDTGAQQYIEGTNVLETVFDTDYGRLVITDFMPLRGALNGDTAPESSPELLRILSCEAGSIEVELEWAPRFDYARATPELLRMNGGYVSQSEASGERLTLGGASKACSIAKDKLGKPLVYGRFRMDNGERLVLPVRWDSDDTSSNVHAALELLEQTIESWHRWLYKPEATRSREWAEEWQDQVLRSELALKLLVHADTGAVAAAGTTSLPEKIGGVRNWDYRFAWIRDAALAVQALSVLGHRDEGNDFLHWAERVSEQHMAAERELQIMYTLHGKPELEEFQLHHLEGYRASQPVRFGNAAADQQQLDVFGELLTSAYELSRQGVDLEPEIWSFLSTITDMACETWREEDDGIWEQRNGPRHYVYSKLMVWVALDRAIHLSEHAKLEGNVARWRRSRDELRSTIFEHGYDAELGVFVQAYDRHDPDASNLLIPLQEFLPFDDPRVQRTIDTTLEQLTENGLVYRYRNDDGLPGEEGAFGLCTFWLVDALALSGRIEEAREIFEGIARRANHVGLFSEQIDPHTGEFLGNMPQAFTHLGLINSTLYLAHAEGREIPGPPLIGTNEHLKALGHSVSAEA